VDVDVKPALWVVDVDNEDVEVIEIGVVVVFEVWDVVSVVEEVTVSLCVEDVVF
jgi:hypothetical protein